MRPFGFLAAVQAAMDGAHTYPSTWPVAITDHARDVVRHVQDKIRGGTGGTCGTGGTGGIVGSGVELPEADVLDSPHLFIGSADALVDKIQGPRERLGITSFLFGDIDAAASVVERLAGT